MIFSSTLRKLVIGAAMVAAPTASFAAVFISVGIAPPPLPVYVQPPLPAEGYIWTPGYWAYGEGGYYWVPGVWVQPPTVGFLWTPAYWGWEGGHYRFYDGYWGPHVGYYGGINYGFGYFGVGFGGGLWVGNHFSYNRAVANFGGVHVTNVYENRTVINTTVVNHASFNGPGGYQARPTPQEAQWSHENHIQPTAAQQQHFQTAAASPQQRFSANGGRPATVAAATPAAFHQQAATRDGFGHANEVNARQGNQQQRINQGVRSGQMTPGETRNVEQRDSSINREAQRDRAANGGTLTGQERQQINQRQNNVSNSIAADKHNANNDAAAAARNNRAPQQERQQAQHVERNNAPHPAEDHPKAGGERKPPHH
jgi:hypothetical protein